jgi:hypothetical protein
LRGLQLSGEGSLRSLFGHGTFASLKDLLSIVSLHKSSLICVDASIATARAAIAASGASL